MSEIKEELLAFGYTNKNECNLNIKKLIKINAKC